MPTTTTFILSRWVTSDSAIDIELLQRVLATPVAFKGEMITPVRFGHPRRRAVDYDERCVLPLELGADNLSDTAVPANDVVV